MTKSELPRVQHLSRKSPGMFSAVEFIAQHWMAEVMQMHADLMRAPAVERAFHQTHLRPGTQDAIFRLRRPPLPARNAHLLPVDRMPGNGKVDHAG